MVGVVGIVHNNASEEEEEVFVMRLFSFFGFKKTISDIRHTPLSANCIAPAVFMYLGLKRRGEGG